MKEQRHRNRLTAAFIAVLMMTSSHTGFACGEEEIRQDIHQLMGSAQQLLELSNIKTTADMAAALRQTSRRQDISQRETRFFNLVEGYELTVPRQARADMTMAGIRAALEWDGVRLEIYREDGATREEFHLYQSRSARFASNETDHTVERERSFQVGEHEASLLSWSRRVLEKVVEDKNHYVSIDMLVEGEGIFTFLFKSSAPLDENTCIAIAASLEVTERKEREFSVRFPGSWNKGRWNQETAAAFERFFGAEGPMNLGIFDPMAPASMDHLLQLERELSYQFPILMSYNNVKDSHNLLPLRRELDNARDHNRLLLLTLMTTVQAGEKGNMAYRLLEGEFDGFLRAFAIEVKLADIPVLLRLESGMNGSGSSCGAARLSRDSELYKAMYRYIFDFFDKEGVQEHVIWVWDPAEAADPAYKWNHPFLYYPGDRYVDVVGLNGFNGGICYLGEGWRSFEEIFEPLYYQMVSAIEKPIMITEFATGSAGGDKEAWVAEMFEQIPDYPAVKAALWWNHSDYDQEGNPVRRYWLDETEELKSLFSEKLVKTSDGYK